MFTRLSLHFISVMLCTVRTANVYGDHSITMFREMKLFRGRNRLRTSIPHSLLNNGTYTIEFLAASEAEQDWLIGPSEDRSVLSFSVQGGHVGSLSFSEDARPGILNPPLPWEVNSDLDATILDAKI